MVSSIRSAAVLAIVLTAAAVITSSCESRNWPPGVREVPDSSPVYSPQEALETFFLPPGFSIELVAAEPMIEDPVAIDFDADGRMWVVEMRAYMPDVDGDGERAPRGRVSVLEDEDGDGRMDRSSVFLDSLVLPRAVKALDRGILVAEPPYLWLARDTTGDLRADVRHVVRDDYGRRMSNPERNPNGLTWGLDNWILSVWYDKRLRIDADGEWSAVPTMDNAQWGVSFDDYGNVFKNSNADPLRVDLIPAHYYAGNPDLERTSGSYVDIVDDEAVWPVRPTPGINRGYRDHMLRADGTLARFTAAGSPVVYRGDRLPPELLNDVFVTEPSGNLVRRFAVERHEDGSMTAENAYDEAEFLASTDERFRPVNLYSGPDGTLYVVDFYRGIVQHRDYLTEYLQNYILQKGLHEPVGLGRIYRVTHENYEPAEGPELTSKSAAELVETLKHPNGWRRDAAQRLLVERRDTSVAALLREIAVGADDERVRLHALWTLDGMGLQAPALPALRDPSPYVRASAVRMLEAQVELIEAVEDSSAIVRRQLAASIGTLPGPLAVEALAELLMEDGDDPIMVDAALSGMAGRELTLIQTLLEYPDAEILADAVAMASAAALHRGEMSPVFALAGENERPAWQRRAVLEGVLAFAPEPPRDEDRWMEFEPYVLAERPAGLLAACASNDADVKAAADRAAERFTWPGKSEPPRPELRPLSPDEQERFDRGRDRFLVSCAPCHGEDGQGRPGEGPALAGSRWVNGDEDPVVRIVLHGKEGEQLMPPMRSLSNEDIASVLTYVRRAWGNRGSTVSPEEVKEIRGRTASRRQPWTADELAD